MRFSPVGRVATLALALLLAPLATAAPQAGKVSRIGILGQSAADPAEARLWQLFRFALRERGWREGENLRIESRWGEDNVAQIPALAAELVQLQVNLIVTRGSIYTEGAKQATASLPMVFTMHADPERTGHVASLAQPGGRLTGLAVQLTEVYTKGLEFLHATIPEATRIAVLWSPVAPRAGALRAAGAGPRGSALGMKRRLCRRPQASSGSHCPKYGVDAHRLVPGGGRPAGAHVMSSRHCAGRGTLAAGRNAILQAPGRRPWANSSCPRVPSATARTA